MKTIHCLSAPDKKMTWLMIIIIGALMSSTLSAQNAKSDIQKINQVFIAQNEFAISMAYNLYANYSSGVVYSTEKGEVERSGQKEYSKLASIETVINDKYAVVIDNMAKAIMVQKAEKMKQKNVLPISLDTIIKYCKSIEYQKTSSDIGEYTLKMGFSDYQQIDIYFNTKTFLLTKLVLYSKKAKKLDENDAKLKKEKPRLEIVFAEINLKPEIAPSVFSEATYITISGNTITGNGKYKNYKIINGLKN